MKIILLAALCITSLVATAEPASAKPNVLFIAIDDLRPELGCYGADYVKSPNIDRIAAPGVLFNRAFCQAPHCTPSRSSLLSGIDTRNFKGVAMTPAELAPGKPTLPAVFRNAGYHTIGKKQKDPTHSTNFDAKLQQHGKKIRA